MARLTRAEAQELNRSRVLAAARAEFAERGFREAKVDVIAERAELTRGAVYSNFPGKRALYFAVLAEDAERALLPSDPEIGLTPREALAAFARAWVTRLPLVNDRESARLGLDLMPEVLASEQTSRPFAQLSRFTASLLGLALERLDPAAGRLVRVAESALTMLHGASLLAVAAPGFVEPFNVITACAAMPDLGLRDVWPERPPIVPPVRAVDEPWSPPAAVDLLTGESIRAGKGVVAILGLHRLSAAEEMIRSATPSDEVTIALVTAEPAELSALGRLVIADFRWHLHHAFPRTAWPRVQIVSDSGSLAAAAGVASTMDGTEVAIRVRDGRIVRRAEGFGACYAVC
ncbi:TetR/AcrR family transcriptional regulator [Kutzneria sp. 744]|uniref:TetR/AcrR family transcriptional regulator n=1 Tax=Kutzneria sp. (strain 744) TaxID=345341 RepID=UPI0003EEB961|nr:TetR/AcrR family transcriptional regulator [Kutzneria sp. 744]EWM17327.1 TetR-family transcriptional regulator [Kutzneria sp. 744]